MLDTAAAESLGVQEWLIPRPALFALLSMSERVVQLSAPAGSGKTFLLRAWIAAERLSDRVAWVSVPRAERDAQVFWLSVLDALRGTRIGSERVRELTAAPDLDGATVVRRLLEDLSSLPEQLWLVIDDLHELQADEALDQLTGLLGNAPPELRFVLATRRDVRLGLHRLRVDGELTEIRAEELRFTSDETRAMLETAGVHLSDGALYSLVARTEGWAAGLRLATLSMARDRDPEHFATGFSGRERAVAEYLLAEVLERQPHEVRQLLLRTSILEQVSGPLADRLTGYAGSERLLRELEDAGAFVVSLNAERSLFRYHHLFADLLALELQRSDPQELPGLHNIAAEWLAEHGHPAEAIRHAQAAENWGLAAQLLSDNCRFLYLDGRITTARELLWRFPADKVVADPELAVLAAGDSRLTGSLSDAERYLALAERKSGSVPGKRKWRYQVGLVIVRLWLARDRNSLEAVADEGKRLLALAESPDALEAGVSEEGLRATALIELGAAELWVGQLEAAERHLEQASEEARRIGQPWLELEALSQSALLRLNRSVAAGEARAREAIELARAHGWEQTALALAAPYVTLASAALWRGELVEVEAWLERAELALSGFAETTTLLLLYLQRAVQRFAGGRYNDALSAWRAFEGIESGLTARHIVATRAQALKLRMLVRMGETQLVERALSDMGENRRASGEMRVVLADLHLAHGNLDGAAEALTPIFAGASPLENPRWAIQALLAKASVDDALGDTSASSQALERALDLAEPEGLVLPFLLHPVPKLLERHSRFRSTHAALVAQILDLLSGQTSTGRLEDVEPLREPLSESELRVLRFLPTNLRAPEIARELFVSLNTIRTHMRNLYRKLGVHSRTDAVKRARELGLLSPASPRR